MSYRGDLREREREEYGRVDRRSPFFTCSPPSPVLFLLASKGRGGTGPLILVQEQFGGEEEKNAASTGRLLLK